MHLSDKVIHAIEDVVTAQKLLNKASDYLDSIVDDMSPGELNKWQDWSIEQYNYIIGGLLRIRHRQRGKKRNK